jgi:hypothetical protein
MHRAFDQERKSSWLRSMWPRRLIALTMLVPMLIRPGRLASQTVVPDAGATRAVASCPTPPPVVLDDPTFPLYTLSRRSAADVACLREALRAGRFEDALRLYFPRSRRPRFVNWVVYVERDGTVHQAVIQNEEPTRVLHNETRMWALVFADAPPTRRAEFPGLDAEKDTADVLIARRVVAHGRDPLIPLIIKGVAKLVSVDASPPTAVSDSVQLARFDRLSLEGVEPPLYVASARFGLSEDTEVELAITPVFGKMWPSALPTPGVGRSVAPSPLRSVYMNVVNARARGFELSVAGGFTVRPKQGNADTLRTGEARRVVVNAYLLGVANVARFRSPGTRLWGRGARSDWRESALGVAVGTNVLTGSVGDDLITGVTVSRLLGYGGLVAGVNWRHERDYTRTEPRDRRPPRPFLALEVRL